MQNPSVGGCTLQPGARGLLYLNFQADFDDLGGRYTEVCGRKIGIKEPLNKGGLDCI